jgi:hypothetical protein
MQRKAWHNGCVPSFFFQDIWQPCPPRNHRLIYLPSSSAASSLPNAATELDFFASLTSCNQSRRDEEENEDEEDLV